MDENEWLKIKRAKRIHNRRKNRRPAKVILNEIWEELPEKTWWNRLSNYEGLLLRRAARGGYKIKKWRTYGGNSPTRRNARMKKSWWEELTDED